MIMNIFDKVLIKAFVEREAQDFTPVKDEEWISKVCQMIHNKVRTIKNGNFLKIQTYRNVGTKNRELTLDIFSGSHNINYIITLCTCGQLTHTCLMRKEKNE